MIALALKLSAAGLGDYWNDADRWIRNQFADCQLLHPDWIYHMAEGGLVSGKSRIPPSAMATETGAIDSSRVEPDVLSSFSTDSDTCDHVSERSLGGFAGWPTANDWFVGHGSGIMDCCTGNATRALYYIWEHMLHYNRGTLSINLLMNCASKWADINSHIPYAGQVDINVKRACKLLRVRIPEWVTPQQVKCLVNGKKRRLTWDKRYALLGSVKTGDNINVNFPITEQKVETDIQSQHYHLITRGNEVVDIYPSRPILSPLPTRLLSDQPDPLKKNYPLRIRRIPLLVIISQKGKCVKVYKQCVFWRATQCLSAIAQRASADRGRLSPIRNRHSSRGRSPTSTKSTFDMTFLLLF